MAQRKISDYFGAQIPSSTIRAVGVEVPVASLHTQTPSANPGNNDNNSMRPTPYNGHHRSSSPPSLARSASSTSAFTNADLPPPTREVRAAIFAQVHRETPSILSSSPLGSANSIYYPSLLPSLFPSAHPPHPPAPIKVVDGDTYSVAEQLLAVDCTNRQGKVVVLNMASDMHPGGGCRKGALAQEETLCYRSTLYVSIDKEGFYPLPPLGGIYSPGVIVFRKEMKDHFAPYEGPNERFVLNVVTIAGLRRPELDNTGQRFATPALQRMLEQKIRQTLRICAVNGQEHIVLGALGCGAFRNPPELVARTFLRVLQEQEWKGRFLNIVFAVMAGNGRQHLVGVGGEGIVVVEAVEVVEVVEAVGVVGVEVEVGLGVGPGTQQRIEPTPEMDV
ncbi:hypothetical protein BDZ91DRAFT_847952 [Kalaharituber pfeilii]|nr:hypothetical protein BDZ91DRAFT_847952 [Kalaharituber pfeilii]